MAFIDLKPGSPNVPTAAQAKEMRQTLFARREPSIAHLDNTDTPYPMSATYGEHCMLFIDASLGNVEIDLPAVTAEMQTIHWKRTDNDATKSVTFDPWSAEQIEGVALFYPPPRSSGTIQSDGSTWWITAFSVADPVENV